MTAVARDRILRNAPIDTWFGVGGGADAYVTPESVDELRALLDVYEGDVRVLGDGANLLVDDAGVGGLVMSLANFQRVEFEEEARGVVRARVGAGVNLPRLIVSVVRDGLGGLEGLGGIPATVGGAVRMNAGGAFGEIGDVVAVVRGVTRRGEFAQLDRSQIPFAYRTSGLDDLIITEVEFALKTADAATIRSRLKDVMAYKKTSQPMAEKSAGCVFRNPTVGGVRVSAGMLIDRAGCKGLRIDGAEVSRVHGNFFITHPGAKAADVLRLIDEVRDRVREHSGAALETEVVIWRREGA